MHTFSEEEELLRESGKLRLILASQATQLTKSLLVKRFAQDVVGPKVREMDENEMMDPSVIKGLFEQGVRNTRIPFAIFGSPSSQLMGVETSAEHGGAESSFTSAIIVIEELAKVDPSVSVLCDVHNTLVNTVIRKYGTPEQHEKWLPQLAESKVNRVMWSSNHSLTNFTDWELLSI